MVWSLFMNIIVNGACYIRVSTNEQAEYSPSAQKRAIFEYAKSHNINIAPCHIFTDEGASGRNTGKRPAFQAMIKCARLKPAPFSVILVHKFDRFSRSREDSIVYKSLLKRECNVKVISVCEPVEDDKFSIILEAFLEAMAEYYSVNLGEEVKKGMTEKAYQGGFQTRPAYGYSIVQPGKPPVINTFEADIIQQIFDMRLSKMSYGNISKYLSLNNIKTRKNNFFTRKSVSYILKNPVYCGYVTWNCGKELIIRKSPDISPIISTETFLEVNPWFASLINGTFG